MKPGILVKVGVPPRHLGHSSAVTQTPSTCCFRIRLLETFSVINARFTVSEAIYYLMDIRAAITCNSYTEPLLRVCLAVQLLVHMVTDQP